MNSINVIRDPSWNPVQRALITFLFSLLNSLVFGNAPLISFVLDKVVTRDLLRNALTNLYQLAENPASRVDDALVDAFFGPAKESHAVEALNQIYTNDPGKTPMEFHQDNEKLKDLPIKLIWGDSDPVTPIEGSVGQFYTALDQDSDNNVSLKMVNSGHIPFDEIPECNEYMVQWLDDLVMEEKQESSAQRFQWPFGR
jgi:pimeloyl-ACP methyl ester carboxylesterase